MAVIPTQTDYELMQLKVRNNRIRVELLNFNFQTIDLIEGKVIDGSISIDATSDIRRTCSVSLVANNSSLKIGEGERIWIDKYIKIYSGTDNPRTGETEWWNMGIFMINNPERVYNATTNTLTFEGIDLMAKLTGRRNGQLPAITTIVLEGSDVAKVVKDTITQLGGFNNYVIQDVGYKVPYEIRKDVGSTIYDLLAELRDLYPDWEMFFDVNGVFHWQKIPTGQTEPVVVDFDQLDQPVIISSSVNLDFENVKNNIIVYGRLLDSGDQINARISDIMENSPYNITKIGSITYIINDERIYTNALALQRAEYELYLHARLNDSIVLEIVPTYWLNDVNVKIRCSNSDIGIDGEYLIKSMDIPLGIGSNMTINAMKIYPEGSALDGLTDDQVAVYYARLYWIGKYGSETDMQFLNAGQWSDGRYLVIISNPKKTETLENYCVLVDITTGAVEELDLTIQEQAEYFAQQWYISEFGGDTEGLSFNFTTMQTSDIAIVAVRDVATQANIMFLQVNIRTGEVTEY